MTLYKIADYAEPLLDFADKGQSEAYLKTKAKAVRTVTLSGLKAGYGVTGTKECGFKVGEPGNYVLAARPFAAGNAGSGKAALQALDGGRQTECLQFRVSAIATAFRQRGNIPEIYSADYRTGEPLKSGNVVFFKDNNSSDRLQNGYKAYDRAEKKQFDGFTSIKDAASKSVSGNRRDRFIFNVESGSDMFSTYPEMADKVRQLVNGGWKKSQISVNSEITGVLLNETPWAYKESEDNRRIDRMKNYLDPNYTGAFRVKAMNKIAALQGSDGGFAWFSGVPSSEWLTMLFLDKMYELEQIGALNPNQKEGEMMKEACKFLDNSLRKQYEDYLRECRKMKKEPDKSFIHWGTLELMAVRSEFPETAVAASSREAYDFYFDCVFNHWKNTNIADKANIIKLLANTADPVGAVADPSAGVSLRAKSIVDDSKYGCAEEVKKVIASLDDYAVKNSSIGCYFPNASMPFRGMMNNELYAHAQLLRMYDRLTDKYLGSALPAEKGLGYDMLPLRLPPLLLRRLKATPARLPALQQRL